MKFRLSVLILSGLLALALILTACSAASPTPTGQAGALRVVATTTIVADVVRAVGGDAISLTTLIPPDVDEHGYEPAPQDAAKVAQANLVFENGAGLEQFIDKLMKNAGGQAKLTALSDGIKLQQAPAGTVDLEAGSSDPHVWMDPNNVLIWVDTIEKTLSAADPAHAAQYQQRAAGYRAQLRDLDAWVREQVSRVPADRRRLVTDHLVFTYFANRYGFEQVGAVTPGYSSLSSPSAHELAALEDAIRGHHVPAVLVGNTVNPALAERVAKDTGVRLVHILTGSLTGPTGPAPTYIDYIKYNVNAIVTTFQ